MSIMHSQNSVTLHKFCQPLQIGVFFCSLMKLQDKFIRKIIPLCLHMHHSWIASNLTSISFIMEFFFIGIIYTISQPIFLTVVNENCRFDPRPK